MSELSRPPAHVAFDHVWKKFRRGEIHDSLRDLLPAVARRLVGRGKPKDQLQQGDFWALEDVSFRIDPGEVLGIIGRNGAGKSTVLKTLTRILRPTRGRFEVSGRVGALIEVAAGFHPDLTGRENVFLQGAIMGMASTETARKFDEIVEFSGISEFIDTPVKRYSSGMNARLGFSIAAHLDPEILIIDEVLAVGDFAFQQRAFGRIKQLATSGIPVVIVSHQLDRVATLCTKAILLERGRVVKQGEPGECISAYLTEPSSAEGAGDGTGALTIRAIAPRERTPVASGAIVAIDVDGVLDAAAEHERYSLGMRVRSSQTGQPVYSTHSARCGAVLPSGAFVLRAELQMNVQPGIYVIETFVLDRARDREESRGPSAFVQVEGGPTYYGPNQLNAQMVPAASRAHGS